ncbi:MAG: type II secretion system GspH family protein [Rhodocyclaceae bacterium]|nr:type II secretion system protein [Sulfuritalea sp.]MCL4681929.1 type II secretion system GspH family protein [Rhodocyclaceae bacterium]
MYLIERTGSRRFGSRGASLVEVIMFIVIVGIAAGGILMVFANMTRASADPLIRKQALAIAESLLEEIRLMPFTFCDPDDANASTATGAFVGVNGCATTVEAMGPDAGETRYAALTPFDNVNDYNGFALAGGILDVTGATVAGLGAYSAAVAVAPFAFGGVAATEAQQITVTVTGPGNVSVVLDGIRTRHAPNL